jgi:hypothetical protein
MHRLAVIIFLFFGSLAHVLTLENASDAMKQLPRDTDYAVVLPSPILKIVSLEYQGLASDMLFLKSMVFIGSTFERQEQPRVKDWEWTWYINVLGASTDLDPYFFDPYYYANAFLTWDAHMTEEANRLLEKGSKYRDWDWMLPFFIGFNDFFFLQNDKDAAEFLMEASRRPGGDPMLASIASRLAFKENHTETAIYFLEETAKHTEDRNLKERFEMRIKSLRSIAFLDKSVILFKKKFKRIPTSIDELLTKDMITHIPQDPYGGTYYITQDGKVRSTTSSDLEPYLSPRQKTKQH